MKYCVQYQVYDLPENAKYVKIVFFQDSAPTKGDPDFNSIAHLYSMGNPKNIVFKGCRFAYAVMTGFCPQGGIGVIVDQCTFEDNGSADPYSHIDWEDGRIHIQGHIVKNCTFISINSTFKSNITDCNSRDVVFRNNQINGGKFSLTSECVNTRIYHNNFSGCTISLASKSDMIYAGIPILQNLRLEMYQKVKTLF